LRPKKNNRFVDFEFNFPSPLFSAAGIPLEEEEEILQPKLVSCPSCGLKPSLSRVKKYWQLRRRVKEEVFNNIGGCVEPMEQCLDFVDQMKPLFSPCEKMYLGWYLKYEFYS